MGCVCVRVKAFKMMLSAVDCDIPLSFFANDTLYLSVIQCDSLFQRDGVKIIENSLVCWDFESRQEKISSSQNSSTEMCYAKVFFCFHETSS